MPEKTCFKCQRTLPLSEFYRHPMMADGYLGKCKDCGRRDVRERRKAALNYYREYDRQRAQAPHRKARALRAMQRERAIAPERARARAVLHQAVRTGKVVRPPVCEDCCQVHAYIHGHHEDYSQPLQVRWLCPSCHYYANRRTA